MSYKTNLFHITSKGLADLTKFTDKNVCVQSKHEQLFKLIFFGVLIPTITNVHCLYLGRAQLFPKFAVTLPDKLRPVAIGNYPWKDS